MGNGDDGTDLEGYDLVEKGPIVESRDLAVKLLQKLNTRGIVSLGDLESEVAKTTLYKTKVDVAATLPEEQGSFHGTMTGKVYARTMARPHAETRFFPIADQLKEDQLIALHIHEGLHRALPASVRENEQMVSRITLAMSAPEGSYDSVRDAVLRTVPRAEIDPLVFVGGTSGSPATVRVSEEDSFHYPSSVGYMYKHFLPPKDATSYRIDHMHIVHSTLYPFGRKKFLFGLGLEGSFIQRANGLETGPFMTSARLRLWSSRGFDVGIFGSGSWNVLSSDELKRSPYCRDVFTAGISLHKDFSHFYAENYLSYNIPGSADQEIGTIKYKYSYGGIIDAKVRAGFKLWRLDFGGFAELHLADYLKLKGGSFDKDFGRQRILSVGPEISFVTDNIVISAIGRVIADSTSGVNFDYLGNLMGTGVSQGSLALSSSIFF